MLHTGSNPSSTSSLFEALIYGQPFSKANQRKLVMIHGRMIPIKSDKARKYEADALKQLGVLWGSHSPILGELRIDMRIWYPSQLQDLDPSLIFDILQRAGVIKNDRQLREQHLYHSIDKVNPRTELSIYARM